MSSDFQRIRIGFSDNHPCSYLPQQQERVAVALDPNLQNSPGFELLLANGFRRSGSTIYKPHCDACNACQAIRIAVSGFKPSKSQRRLLNKAKTLNWVMKKHMDENWYDLFAGYIEKRHYGGSMYPPNKHSFEQFANSDCVATHYLHIYDNEQLVAIAITDMLDRSCSSFYTFFDPDYPMSLGTLAVLYQIEYCQMTRRDWLYLGYQIDECASMNYKVRYHNHQRLVNRLWQG